MVNIEIYKTESGRCPLKDFIGEIAKSSAKNSAQLLACIKRFEQHGMDINKYYPNSMKYIENDICELRPGGNRVLFFYYDKNGRYILLHGFKKKTLKTPQNEKEKALREQSDYIRRMENEEHNNR